MVLCSSSIMIILGMYWLGDKSVQIFSNDSILQSIQLPGPIAQSIVCLIADPGVMSLNPAQPHTFMEIDHIMFSMVILLLPLIQERLLSVTCECTCTDYWFNG